MGTESVRFSVVIPVRDAKTDLSRCLDSLERQTVGRSAFEVVVIDDGSSDGTPDAARQRGARVFSQDRLGAAVARNRGVVEAAGELVLFLDADCVAEPDWIEELTRPLRGDPGIAGAVGRYDSDQMSLVARFVQLDLESRYDRMSERDRIDFLNSGNCAFRRDILLRHPFDPRFQRLEDVELSFRLTDDGHAMVYVAGARARHRHPESVGALVKRKFNYARYVFPLYRQYPGKTTSDSSTPQSRRWRLVFLGLFLLVASFAWAHPAVAGAALGLAILSVAASGGIVARAFARGLDLGLATVFFLFVGNLAFVAGTARGLLAGKAPEAN